jgi:GrpB-like predicted nucleotidyltransferase (UPF0157 family)
MKIVPYLSTWGEQFNQIKIELTQALQSHRLEIHHIGSTAILNMSSKPIIDVLVVLDDLDIIDRYQNQIEALGYIAKGEHGIKNRRYFVKFSIDGINHQVHLHCFEKGNIEINHHLMFRDYLNLNQDAFNFYLSVKKEAENRFRFDPAGYTQFKSEAISDLLCQAKKYFDKSS